MKTILVVDDTQVVRTFLTRILKPHDKEFRALTAEHGAEALEIVESVKVDLVITDIEMPVMDGFALLAHLSNNHPDVPVFVMTAKGSPEVEERINALGSIQYFEKPMNIEMLLSSIRNVFESSARGEINGISLASFLQLVNMEGKTCLLKVRSRGRSGCLYCMKGELIAADTAALKAEAAAYELLGWDSTVIEITDFKTREREIQSPLMNILMEGLRRKDEEDVRRKQEQRPLKMKPVPKKVASSPQRTSETKQANGNPDKPEDKDISSLYQWD